MRSREQSLLLRKELAELFASRAFWLLLLIVGLLAGQAFIQAVNDYAEASGINGGPAALAQALSPLDGILGPALGAYELAITLLFPFVAIRVIAAEKSSDALKLMLQWPASLHAQLGAKVAALLMVWMISLIPFAAELVLWRFYGGHLYAPEVLNLLAGYTLRFLLTASVSMAVAAILPGAANAAIVILGMTIGTWLIDFVAAGRGGLLQTLAAFTPSATTRAFERGLLRIDVVLVVTILTFTALVISAIWLRLGNTVAKRTLQTVAAIVIAAIAVAAATRVRTSFDLSENRRNSFAPAEERMLSAIAQPLTITVFLAAEDPRMNDFETNILGRLRRVVPRLRVVYPLQGRSGLFENDARYGEIHYQLGARSETNRSTTEAIVIETIAHLAGVRAPEAEESTYPGYPLAVRPRGAAFLFYVLWPVAAIAAWLIARSRRSRRTG